MVISKILKSYVKRSIGSFLNFVKRKLMPPGVNRKNHLNSRGYNIGVYLSTVCRRVFLKEGKIDFCLK